MHLLNNYFNSFNAIAWASTTQAYNMIYNQIFFPYSIPRTSSSVARNDTYTKGIHTHANVYMHTPPHSASCPSVSPVSAAAYTHDYTQPQSIAGLVTSRTTYSSLCTATAKERITQHICSTTMSTTMSMQYVYSQLTRQDYLSPIAWKASPTCHLLYSRC